MKFTQVDFVSYYLVVGSFKPGNHHGMGDRLVVRKCRSRLRAHPLSEPSTLIWICEQLSQLNYIIDTYLFAAASALASNTVIRR